MDVTGKTVQEIQQQINKLQIPLLMTPAELMQEFKRLHPQLQQFLENVDKNPFWRSQTSMEELDSELNLPLPSKPQSWEDIIQFLKMKTIPHFSSVSNKHFMAFIPGDPAPPAILGAMMTPIFNQWVGGTLASPGGVAIESLALKWIIELLNLPTTSWGSFTSGGSMANLTSLYAGLSHQAPWLKAKGYYSGKRVVVYYSEEAHFCVPRAFLMLGLGHDNLRKIPTNDRYQMDLVSLTKKIEEDLQQENVQPAIIVASAGTTNTGAIDPLVQIAEIAKKYNLWFHVDAAYGGFAKISLAKEALQGLELADSIALDAHKWLYAPFEAGISLVKDAKILKRTYQSFAEYTIDHIPDEEFTLLRNFKDYGFPLTRELRGLKIWFLIMAYGKEGLSQFITKNILLADYLEAKIRIHPELELMSTSNLAIVCFRYKATDEQNETLILTMQQRQKFYLSRTTVKGRVTIRACILNLRVETSTIDELIKEIDTIAKELRF